MTQEQASAADLIAQAQAATTPAQLDEIEAQANDRVTVIDAVEARRAELEGQPASLDEALATEGTPLEPEVPEGGLPPQAAEAPPPIEAPPVPESLAEQVYRESHSVPESVGPSDYVPNRPNIRSPEDVGAVEQPEEPVEEEVVVVSEEEPRA